LFVIVAVLGCGRINFGTRSEDAATSSAFDGPPAPIGELDPDFGIGGIAFLDEGRSQIPADIAERATGYLIIGTSTTSVDALALTDDGAVDRSWGTNGATTGPSGVGLTVLVRPDERALIAGIAGVDSMALMLTANGTVDMTFATNGVFSHDGGGDDDLLDIATIANTFVLCGMMNGDLLDTGALFVRVDSNGSLVPGFGNGGVLAVDDTTAFDSCEGLVATSTELLTTGTLGRMVAVRRLALDGTVLAAMQIGGLGTGTAIVRAGNGAIYVSASNGPEVAVIKLHADLSRDLTFGDQGSASVAVSNALLFDIVLQSDGKIVGVGTSGPSSDVAYLARWMPDGTLDPAFGVGGTLLVPRTGHATTLRAVLIDRRGRLVAIGVDYVPSTPNTFRPFVARLR
jgi:uncharacterized delta-60 repeat protein